MWMPVCGPFPELQHGPRRQDDLPVRCMSIIPTVPAGWLTFADGAVYKAYDHARAGVGDQRHRRPAARRGDHEGRRLAVPVDDHRRALLQAVRGPLRRGATPTAGRAASRTPRSPATTPSPLTYERGAPRRSSGRSSGRRNPSVSADAGHSSGSRRIGAHSQRKVGRRAPGPPTAQATQHGPCPPGTAPRR